MYIVHVVDTTDWLPLNTFKRYTSRIFRNHLNRLGERGLSAPPPYALTLSISSILPIADYVSKNKQTGARWKLAAVHTNDACRCRLMLLSTLDFHLIDNIPSPPVCYFALPDLLSIARQDWSRKPRKGSEQPQFRQGYYLLLLFVLFCFTIPYFPWLSSQQNCI